MAAYNFLPLAAATIVLYAISWFFARQGKHLSVPTHRKIWNGLLLISFVGLIVFSFLNVLAYDTGINVLPTEIDVGFWHVEFGIVCMIITAFHVLWHISYFQQYLPKEKPKQTQAAPVSQAQAEPQKPLA